MRRPAQRRPQMFLLSPAYCGGRRAKILLKPNSEMSLAKRLAEGSLTLGEAFSFLSGLYFRGKLTYARAFGNPGSPKIPPTLVITPTRGLQPPELPITAALIQEFASVDVHEDDARYRVPLGRDLAALATALPKKARVVLLGSVATGKYVELLTAALGRRLHYPPSFIGRGDMSRGGLLLRCASAATELEYAVLDHRARRHGPRPAKLPPLRR